MKFSIVLALLMLSGVTAAENTVLEVIPLSNRPASELQPLLAPLLEDTDRVIDNGSNLIVKTTPARLENIRNLIKKLDTRLNNLIVTVFQNSYKTAAELNAEAGMSISSSGIRMGGMNADTRDVINSRNTQVLRTLDGQPAHIETGRIKPVQNVTVYGAYNGQPAASVNTQMVEASTGFAVTPRLSGQQVIIDIEPWSDHFQQNGNIAIQGARTTLRANLGEWVEIAGNDTGDAQSSSGFNTFNQTTVQNNLRILIKVDKAD